MISVIIPVYNVEAYIANCLTSVLNQTYKNFQLILVNDGSCDQSVQVAEKILSAQTTIPYKIINQNNSGLGAARNRGFDDADGEWLLFLDSDDTIQNFTLSLYADLTQKYPDTDMIFSNFRCVSYDEIFKVFPRNDQHICYSKSELAKLFLLRQKTFLVPGTLYRKKFLEDNNIRHCGIRWSEDQHFMWQVIGKIHRAVGNESVTYNYLMRNGSIMNSTPIKDIVIAEREFHDLELDTDCELIKRFRLARWILGTLHSTSKFYSCKEWLYLYRQMDSSQYLKKLLFFPIKKIAILGILGAYSPLMLYLILKNR